MSNGDKALELGPLDRTRRGEAVLAAVVSVLFTCLAMAWSYSAKVKCGGPPFNSQGRSRRWPVGDPDAVIPCYSDMMNLWVGRGINDHVFPYIHGGITESGHLVNGAVEYPVLSGMLMWLGAIGAHTDLAFFNHSAIILAPFGIIVTLLLVYLVRWWALLWAATPPLVLYAFHNWELPVVATCVGGIAVVAWGASLDADGKPRLSLRTAAVLAAVLFGIGFSLKLYPGFFVLPLALYVLTRGGGFISRVRAPKDVPLDLDWRGFWTVAGAATATVTLTQAPFMILGWQGWRGSLSFQGKRKADVDTNSIWYWGWRHLTGGVPGKWGTSDGLNSFVGVASPVLIVASFVLAVWLGWRVYSPDKVTLGVYPWIGVCGAMLAGFMVFHKVHSPQYTLWILPFFVLLNIRWQVIVAYLAADLALDLTIFRLFGIINNPSNPPMKWWVVGGVNFGVWVHAALLIYLIFAFVKATPREPLASFGFRLPAAAPEPARR
ncbi:hypothetical protein GOARA_006_00350 [Gordonia araii NBRC 100433]|uniref:DUF2029 domain-containing protein n=1 Tax=Gordonia araii NBRC 100433 TaxID=1073574 RepID=G7GXF1_9ACTN|nr:membrane protein [Gordonia araii]NNG95938.1 hypothetical protein [Gordonia araii NBRC 100433]GAB08276.1 hypothetical protein GOARA_006_00350 [Gordonia araii NBRC 100433]